MEKNISETKKGTDATTSYSISFNQLRLNLCFINKFFQSPNTCFWVMKSEYANTALPSVNDTVFVYFWQIQSYHSTFTLNGYILMIGTFYNIMKCLEDWPSLKWKVPLQFLKNVLTGSNNDHCYHSGHQDKAGDSEDPSNELL